MLLPDVNVWIALTFDSHVHHPRAKNWFDGLSNEMCFFCRVTQQGLLRLSTNASIKGIGSQALTLPEAWQKYDLFLSDSLISFAAEPPGLEPHWRTFTQFRSFSTNVWNDAYLAAFALAANLEVVTFDKAFSQYQPARCKILA